MLPGTTSKKGTGRRWPLYALVTVMLVALWLGVEDFVRAEKFTPREEVISPAIRDVVVSAEDSPYPPTDTDRFEEPPGAVYVYLSVAGMPAGEDVEARVERRGSGSVFSSLFGGSDLEALDEQEAHLGKGQNGASGVIKFALKTESGDPVSPGDYTVEIYASGTSADEGGEGAVAARKLFIVE